jgi:hypothetical protein
MEICFFIRFALFWAILFAKIRISEKKTKEKSIFLYIFERKLFSFFFVVPFFIHNFAGEKA